MISLRKYRDRRRQHERDIEEEQEMLAQQHALEAEDEQRTAGAVVEAIDEALRESVVQAALQDARRDRQVMSRQRWDQVYGEKFYVYASCTGETVYVRR